MEQNKLTFHYAVASDYEGLSKLAAETIIEQVKKKPDSLLCLAAGSTPTGTLNYLAEAAKRNEVDFSNCYIVGLDEFVGLSWEDEGSCYRYVNEFFFEPLNISKDRIHFFKAQVDDLEKECDETDRYIQEHGGIDVLLLGVGVNGHLGLNEPNVSLNLNSHVIELEATTKKVGQKYFSEAKKLEKGITIGLKQVLESKTVVVIANGPLKKEAMAALLKGSVDEKYPVSCLNLHENCFVYVDKEANPEI
ncbi:glucosamine-6-phosphate deaminase [Neobacillus novalis]|uniref:Glucosamine-6-phosphate deaminase n=1 Tax=Neobacillus novalis TaxID=220687 RepID=A0AA95MQC0_9BACI|nr:glucosamine-6-phosphate deaminase [Neobacillus novalis]WHY85945.1 glucosamine-6-phosphate deaminase [Neobacillus novalis]